MYYVIQVAPREERNVEALIRELLPCNVCRQCFHLRRHILKKYHGEWHDVHEKLLPGYVFVETDDIGRIYEELQKIDRFSKVLGQEDIDVIALTNDDVSWLVYLLTQCENYEIPLSQVYVRNEGSINIISGPLKFMENIKKYDLHKRIAEVEIVIGNQIIMIHLDLQIIKTIKCS